MHERPESNAGRNTNERVFLGLGSLYASVGDHIAHFYQSREEWRALLVPFLATGLKAGDKCICVTDPDSGWRELKEALTAAGVNVDDAMATEQLVLGESMTSPEVMLDWYVSVFTETQERFPFFRCGGDSREYMEKMSSIDTIMDFEVLCNSIEDPLSGVVLCQYDLTQFPGSGVIDILRTHPLCIIGSIVHQNSLYEKPEVFREELRHRRVAHKTS